MNSRQSSFLTMVIILTLIGLSGCQLKKIAPETTVTPTLLETTQAPTLTPLPSATYSPTATFSPDTIYISDYGLRIQRPKNWNSGRPNDADLSSIIFLNSKDKQVNVIYLASPVIEGMNSSRHDKTTK